MLGTDAANFAIVSIPYRLATNEIAAPEVIEDEAFQFLIGWLQTFFVKTSLYNILSFNSL